jgi:hypothetical protein
MIHSSQLLNVTAIRTGSVFGICLVVVLFAGCDSPDRTLDTIRKDLAAYKTTPTPENELKVETSLAKLDTQVADLQRDGRTAEAAAVESLASNLRGDFRAARMVNSLRDAQSAIQGIGEAIKDAGKSIGDVFEEKPASTP